MNPFEVTLFKPAIDRVIDNNGISSWDSSAGGRYACQESIDHCKSKGMKTIVFNNVTKSLEDTASILKMETQLQEDDLQNLNN